MRAWHWSGWFFVGLWLCTYAAYAQPTINPQVAWQHQYQPANRVNYVALAQLTQHRFIAAGYADLGTSGVPRWLMFRPNGDTIASATLTQFALPQRGVILFQIAPKPDGSFLGVSQDYDSLSYLLLLHFDSSGTMQWQHRVYAPAGVTWFPDNCTPLALPNGYLIPLSFSDVQQVYYGSLLKLDLQGNIEWQYTLGRWSSLGRRNIIACPDGAYAISAASADRFPLPHLIPWDAENLVLRFHPRGYVLDSAYNGTPKCLDSGNRISPTPDGGFLLAGSRTPQPPSGQRRQPMGHVVKLDSLLRRQWEVRLPTTVAGQSCILNDGQALANGHYRVLGYTTLPGGSGSAAYHYAGLVAEIAPPLGSGPADTLGRIVGQWTNDDGWYWRAMSLADGSAIVSGVGTATANQQAYLARLTGLGTPAPAPNLCAHPPVLGPASFGPLVGATLPFTLDSLTTAAGPRYGEISRVSWDFGDGSPNQLGWQVQHTFASPQPVRVRVCAMNNLWCQTCTDLYPFGVPTATPDDQLPLTVNVWPNPSADGRFHLTPPPAPSPAGRGSLILTVTDALGRVVWRGTYAPSLGGGRGEEIDLSRCAPGVYTLHGQAGDGRRFNRKLVR